MIQLVFSIAAAAAQVADGAMGNVDISSPSHSLSPPPQADTRSYHPVSLFPSLGLYCVSAGLFILGLAYYCTRRTPPNNGRREASHPRNSYLFRLFFGEKPKEELNRLRTRESIRQEIDQEILHTAYNMTTVAFLPPAFQSTENLTPRSNTPTDYICPITYQVMHDPVKAPDGVTYEREALSQYFQRGARVCPLNHAVALPSPDVLETDLAKLTDIRYYLREQRNLAAATTGPGGRL